MIKIICLTGQNRSGKDTLANKLQEKLNRRGYKSHKFSFATPLKESFRELFHHRFILNGNDILNGDVKDDMYINISTGMLGFNLKGAEGYVTIREAIKDYAEKVIKPIYGETVFARNVINNIRSIRDNQSNTQEFVILTDIRFDVELRELFSEDLNECKKYLINVTRDGNINSIDGRFVFEDRVTYVNCHNKDSIEYEVEVDKILNLCVG